MPTAPNVTIEPDSPTPGETDTLTTQHTKKHRLTAKSPAADDLDRQTKKRKHLSNQIKLSNVPLVACDFCYPRF